MEKRKKAVTKPANILVNVAIYAIIFFNVKKKQVSMELENRPILIAGFAGSR